MFDRGRFKSVGYKLDRLLITFWDPLKGISLPAVVFSFIFRGGLLLFLFGIAVQMKDGRRASRFRCFVRALVGWSPALVLWLPKFEVVQPLPDSVLALLLLIIVSGTIYAFIKPERGLPDLIVGTQLVPR
jgi:hypothetical protein